MYFNCESRDLLAMSQFSCVLRGISRIEGLHNAIRTYMRMTLPRSLVSFFLLRGMEKNNQTCSYFWFTL